MATIAELKTQIAEKAAQRQTRQAFCLDNRLRDAIEDAEQTLRAAQAMQEIDGGEKPKGSYSRKPANPVTAAEKALGVAKKAAEEVTIFCWFKALAPARYDELVDEWTDSNGTSLNMRAFTDALLSEGFVKAHVGNEPIDGATWDNVLESMSDAGVVSPGDIEAARTAVFAHNRVSTVLVEDDFPTSPSPFVKATQG